MYFLKVVREKFKKKSDKCANNNILKANSLQKYLPSKIPFQKCVTKVSDSAPEHLKTYFSCTCKGDVGFTAAFPAKLPLTTVLVATAEMYLLLTV